MSKKKEVSIRQMPTSVKPTSTYVEKLNIMDDNLASSTAITSALSASWVGGAVTVAGFVLIPNTEVLFALPVILSFFVATGFACSVIGALLEDVRGNIDGLLDKLEDMTPTKDSQRDLLDKGMKIYSKSGGKKKHFFLPIRVFKKIRMNENIRYFPHQDKYVKETHYLTFTGWVRKTEHFDGHRAVFQKAIDSF